MKKKKKTTTGAHFKQARDQLDELQRQRDEAPIDWNDAPTALNVQSVYNAALTLGTVIERVGYGLARELRAISEAIRSHSDDRELIATMTEPTQEEVNRALKTSFEASTEDDSTEDEDSGGQPIHASHEMVNVVQEKPAQDLASEVDSLKMLREEALERGYSVPEYKVYNSAIDDALEVISELEGNADCFIGLSREERARIIALVERAAEDSDEALEDLWLRELQKKLVALDDE